jgi:O-acetyl-ADP-ribose deacetylase (regulator of RNase III)
MIRYTIGNFFDYEADIRINTVNCVGVMGAGAALQFKNKYPAMFEKYSQACKLGQVKIGHPHVWQSGEGGELFKEKKVTIINFPTKDHWKKPSEYEFVEKGLVWLRDYLKDKENCTITLPALGCGHGGLEWSIVKKQIEKHLHDLKTNILVFEPASSLSNDVSPEDAQLLEKENVKRLFATDPNYPKGLKGTAAFDIYIKGDINIFNQKKLCVIIDSKATDKEKEIIYGCIDALPNDKFVYVLGFNSSAEIDLVKKILEKGSKVLVTLPHGILELKIRQDLKALWNEELITIVSTSSPRQPWKVNESINALKFRIKTSDAILLSNLHVEVIGKLKMELETTDAEVFYLNFWKEPNYALEAFSATYIGKNKQTNGPNIVPILQHLNGNYLIYKQETYVKGGTELLISPSKKINILNSIFSVLNLNPEKQFYQLEVGLTDNKGTKVSQGLALDNRVRKFNLNHEHAMKIEYPFLFIKSHSQEDINISLSIVEYNEQ